jgi:hypothetical protein
VSGQLHAPATLPPGKNPRYLFYRRLGGPQSRSGRYGEVNIFDPPGLELPPSLIVQPVASRSTDWAIPAPLFTSGIYQKPVLILHRTCPLYRQFYLQLEHGHSEQWYFTSDFLILCMTSYWRPDYFISSSRIEWYRTSIERTLRSHNASYGSEGFVKVVFTTIHTNRGGTW